MLKTSAVRFYVYLKLALREDYVSCITSGIPVLSMTCYYLSPVKDVHMGFILISNF